VPWQATNTPAKRRRDAEVYRDPEFVRDRAIVLRRAGGRCEECGRRGRLQVDHITPVAVRVDHSLGNLQALCSGPGSCHAAKTARDSNATRREGDPDFSGSRTRW